MADQLLGQEGAPPQGPEEGPRCLRAAAAQCHERSRTARAHEPLEAAESRVGIGHLGEWKQQERESSEPRTAAEVRVRGDQPQLAGPPLRLGDAVAAQEGQGRGPWGILEQARGRLGRDHAPILRSSGRRARDRARGTRGRAPRAGSGAQMSK